MAVFSLLFALFSLLFPILGVIGILYFIKFVTSKKGNQIELEEESEDMLRNVYTYLVLFATLMMSIGGSVGVFMGVANYIIPEPYVESYDTYRDNYWYTQGNEQYTDPEMSIQPVDEKEVRESYDQMKEDAEQTERRSALKLIIQSVGWIVIPLPIFLFFQKQVKEQRRDVTPPTE